jgi:adenylylsulfate kinase
MKILICGLPGSGKTTLATPFAKLIGAVHLNADAVRKEYDDWDFSLDGRIRQAQRMRYLADGVVKAGKIAVADFIAPTKKARQEFGANFVVWMDTIKEGRFTDTNRMYEPLTAKEYDYHVSEWFNDTHLQLLSVVAKYMQDGSGRHYRTNPDDIQYCVVLCTRKNLE